MRDRDQILALANVIRRVRTKEGEKKYGQPIGSIITEDVFRNMADKMGLPEAKKGLETKSAHSGAAGSSQPDGPDGGVSGKESPKVGDGPGSLPNSSLEDGKSKSPESADGEGVAEADKTLQDAASKDWGDMAFDSPLDQSADESQMSKDEKTLDDMIAEYDQVQEEGFDAETAPEGAAVVQQENGVAVTYVKQESGVWLDSQTGTQFDGDYVQGLHDKGLGQYRGVQTVTTIAGLAFTKEEIANAVYILENSAGIMIKQPLNKYGNGVAKVPYNSLAKAYNSEMKAKPAFISYLKSLLASIPDSKQALSVWTIDQAPDTKAWPVGTRMALFRDFDEKSLWTLESIAPDGTQEWKTYRKSENGTDKQTYVTLKPDAFETLVADYQGKGFATAIKLPDDYAPPVPASVPKYDGYKGGIYFPQGSEVYEAVDGALWAKHPESMQVWMYLAGMSQPVVQYSSNGTWSLAIKKMTKIDPIFAPSGDAKKKSKGKGEGAKKGPVNAPNADPQNAPEAAPQNAPEVAPVDAPEAAPQNAPEADPQNAPEVAPTKAKVASKKESAPVQDALSAPFLQPGVYKKPNSKAKAYYVVYANGSVAYSNTAGVLKDVPAEKVKDKLAGMVLVDGTGTESPLKIKAGVTPYVHYVESYNDNYKRDRFTILLQDEKGWKHYRYSSVQGESGYKYLSDEELAQLQSSGSIVDRYYGSVLSEPFDLNGDSEVFVGGHRMSAAQVKQVLERLDLGDLNVFPEKESAPPKWYYASWRDWAAEWAKKNLTPGEASSDSLIAKRYANHLRDILGIPISEDVPTVETDGFEQVGVFKKSPDGYMLPTATPEHIYNIDSYLTTTQLRSRIKAISAEFGNGNVVGLYSSYMSKDTAREWLDAWRRGNMAKCFAIEKAAVFAKTGKPHKAEDLHPGNNPETASIAWLPAVPGEIPATAVIEGDWSTSTLISAQEADNYLILARMQNPEYLTPSEKIKWVQGHRLGLQERTDRLSTQALERKKSGGEALSATPIWTDGLQPAKSYSSYLKDPNLRNNYESWLSHAAGEYWDEVMVKKIAETPHLAKSFEEWAADKPVITAATADGVPGWMKRECLIAVSKFPDPPVYQFERAFAAGTNPVWLIKDQYGKRFVFKPVKPTSKFRAEVETMSNKLGELFGYPSLHTEVLDIPEGEGHDEKLAGTYGMVQEYLDIASDLMGKDIKSLTDSQIGSVAAEHVLDWVLDNDDTHGENLVILNDGSLVGIDKGRSFINFGRWRGLAKGREADSNMLPGKTLISTDLILAVRNGELTQDQVNAAYFSVMAKARAIEKVDRAKVDALLAEGLKNRTNWTAPGNPAKTFEGNVPTNLAELQDRVDERRRNLVKDFDNLWTSIIEEGGYEKIESGPPESHYGGVLDPLFHANLPLTKSSGASAMVDDGTVWNKGYVHMWVDSRDGNLITRAEGILEKDASIQVSDFLRNVVDNGWGGPNPDQESLVAQTEALREKWKSLPKGDDLTAYLKELSDQIDAVAALRGTPEEDRQVKVSNDFLDSVIIPRLEKLQKWQETEEWGSFDEYSPKDWAPDPPFKVRVGDSTAPSGELKDGMLHTADGQFLERGTQGKSFYVTLPTGEEIQIRDGVSPRRTQRGLVQITGAPNTSSMDTMRRFSEALEKMGLPSITGPVDEQGLELLYWRQMHDMTVNRTSDSGKVLKVRSLLDSAKSIREMSNAEQLEFYREAFSSLVGRDKLDLFVAEKGYLPQFGHQELTQPDLPTGKPFFYRFDIDPSELSPQNWKKFPVTRYRRDISTTNVVESGGAMSTEERVRILGYFHDGLSSITDQEYGGARYVFARLNQGFTEWKQSIFYSPKSLLRVDTYAYDSDMFGKLSARRNYAPFDIRHAADTYSGVDNEVMFSDTVTILDDIEVMTFPNEKRRQEAVAKLAKAGITEIRGIPVEERFVLANKSAVSQALAKCKEAYERDNPPGSPGQLGEARVATEAEKMSTDTIVQVKSGDLTVTYTKSGAGPWVGSDGTVASSVKVQALLDSGQGQVSDSPAPASPQTPESPGVDPASLSNGTRLVSADGKSEVVKVGNNEWKWTKYEGNLPGPARQNSPLSDSLSGEYINKLGWKPSPPLTVSGLPVGAKAVSINGMDELQKVGDSEWKWVKAGNNPVNDKVVTSLIEDPKLQGWVESGMFTVVQPEGAEPGTADVPAGVWDGKDATLAPVGAKAVSADSQHELQKVGDNAWRWTKFFGLVQNDPEAGHIKDKELQVWLDSAAYTAVQPEGAEPGSPDVPASSPDVPAGSPDAGGGLEPTPTAQELPVGSSLKSDTAVSTKIGPDSWGVVSDGGPFTVVSDASIQASMDFDPKSMTKVEPPLKRYVPSLSTEDFGFLPRGSQVEAPVSKSVFAKVADNHWSMTSMNGKKPTGLAANIVYDDSSIYDLLKVGWKAKTPSGTPAALSSSMKTTPASPDSMADFVSSVAQPGDVVFHTNGDKFVKLAPSGWVAQYADGSQPLYFSDEVVTMAAKNGLLLANPGEYTVSSESLAPDLSQTEVNEGWTVGDLVFTKKQDGFWHDSSGTLVYPGPSLSVAVLAEKLNGAPVGFTISVNGVLYTKGPDGWRTPGLALFSTDEIVSDAAKNTDSPEVFPVQYGPDGGSNL